MSWHCYLHTDAVFCEPRTRFFLKYPTRVYYKGRHICHHRAIYTYQAVLCCSARPSKSSRNKGLGRDLKPCEICALISNYSWSYVNFKKWGRMLEISSSTVNNLGRLISGPAIQPFLSLVFMPQLKIHRDRNQAPPK